MLAAAIYHDIDPKLKPSSYRGLFSDLRWPLKASRKYDGIRGLKLDGEITSRTKKPIPNEWITKFLSTLPDGVDGEIVTYTEGIMDPFYGIEGVQSKVMSVDGEPDFIYWVFDYCPAGFDFMSFDERYALLEDVMTNMSTSPEVVKLVEQLTCHNPDELAVFETDAIKEGYEGVMLRKDSAPYKSGRSTFDQHYLLKLKRFQDAEAEIIGFEPEYENTNAPTIGLLGQTERSSHQDGLIAKNRLGSLLCRNLSNGVEFSIGSGFTWKEREELWEVRDTLLGKLANYKFQPHGTVDRPRIPIYRGIRQDLSAITIEV